MTTAIDVQTFGEGTFLLSLSTHRIGNRQALLEEEYTAGTASKEMTSAHKKLFRDCAELRAINSHLNSTKKWVEARSNRATMRGGMHFVKAEAVITIEDYLRKRDEELTPVIDAFISVLDDRIAESKKELGSLADNAVYPTAERIRRRFRIEWNWLRFETPGSLESLDKAMYDREMKKSAAIVREACDTAVGLLTVQMRDLVEHMVERLTPGDDGKRKIFKSATVENLAEFLDLFDLRAMGDTADLQKLVDKSKALLEGVDADLLRDEEGVRTAIATGFTKVKSELDKLVVERPKRSIDFDDED